MKVQLLYTPGTPADREVEYLQRKLAERHIELDLLDADSREGAVLAELYDVAARPAVVLTANDGRLVQQWQAGLPAADEISYYYTAR
jgi:hypothetical protein